MFDANDARALMDAHLQAVSGLPDLDTENTPYKPGNDIWCRSTMLPAASNVAAWGGGVTLQLQGIYQVDVIAPWGTTTTQTSAICKSIVQAFFPGGAEITDGTNKIIVTNVSQLPAIEDKDTMQYSTPLQVQWTAYTTL
jgi:hypothetical protein